MCSSDLLKKDIHAAQISALFLAKKYGQNISITDTPYYKRVLEGKLKAFNVTDFANWIPVLNTRFFFEEFEIAPGLADMFESYPMQSRTETVPGAINRLFGQLQSDSSTFSPQSNVQSQYQITAQDLVCHTVITEDLIQDAQPSMFDRLRKEIMLGNLRARDYAILNGDDTTTSIQGDNHMDSDIAAGAASQFAKGFKGLRKRALGNSANGVVISANGDTLSKAAYDDLFASMDKFADDSSDLLAILSPRVKTRIITGAIPELLTIQNFGQNATLATGKLPAIYGIEHTSSEWMREDLNSSGVYAAASALTSLILVKKSRFIVGQRQGSRLWATPSLANQDQMLMTCKERMTFGGVPQGPNEKSVAIMVNLAK